MGSAAELSSRYELDEITGEDMRRGNNVTRSTIIACYQAPLSSLYSLITLRLTALTEQLYFNFIFNKLAIVQKNYILNTNILYK